ncbi:MAG: MSHA biogenesis protein MshP [Alteromonadaceae bacterium]|jgi:MSHA biogenesis protein MshP
MRYTLLTYPKNSTQRSTLKQQQGSMLIIAVFVLTVMILLAGAMQSIYSSAAKAVTYEVYGTRALSAANSGAERAMQKIFFLNGQAALNCVGGANTQWDISAQAAFNGCKVDVICTSFAIIETGYTHYRVESTASCTAGDFTTVRTVAVEGRERS